MEVHHHAHPEVSGPRKKWTHYFWEFLMLFLAVTLGFIVENRRERYVENHRAAQLVRTYISDLQGDTGILNFQIPIFEDKIRQMDSLLSCFINNKPERAYKFFWHASTFHKFFPVDLTLQQLKNAGGMRMISKKGVADSIARYDKETVYVQMHIETALLVNARELSDLENQIYDFTLLDGWGRGVPRSRINYPEQGKLLTYDPKIIAKYTNELINAQRDYASQLRYLTTLRGMAERLISFLNSKYH